MRIGIDLRGLLTPCRTGVAEFTVELLKAILKIDQTNDYYLFDNALHPNTNPFSADNRRHIITRHWPNKLLNCSLLAFQRPRLDRLTGAELDVWFSPNLNFMALSPKIRHILTIHDLSYLFFPELYTTKQMLWHRLLNPAKKITTADKIIVPSENTKCDVCRVYRVPPEKITVITPGLSPDLRAWVSLPETEKNLQTDRLRQKYQLSDRLILFLGTIEPRKNIPALITAFEQSFSYLPCPYTLVIAGAPGWNNRAILESVRRSPRREHIRIISPVPAEDKPALYHSASLFVYPSLYEGFGFPVLEAMAGGVPVITSERGSLPEVGGLAAYYVNPHRPQDISAGIVRLANNEALRNNFIAEGRKRAERFTWENAAASWLKTI